MAYCVAEELPFGRTNVVHCVKPQQCYQKKKRTGIDFYDGAENPGILPKPRELFVSPSPLLALVGHHGNMNQGYICAKKLHTYTRALYLLNWVIVTFTKEENSLANRLVLFRPPTLLYLQM